MKKVRQISTRTRSRVGEKLSSAALADYLAHLANSHDLAETGNPLLADALRALAKAVRRKSVRISTGESPTSVAPRLERRRPAGHDRKKPKPPAEIRAAVDAKTLTQLTEGEIREFIGDESKTKDDLLRLASARFSMPLSQLRRSKSAEIRQTILSALLHESSMEIISKEAEREGKARSS
ncbi:hypothetical protein R69619_03704 [Paraburkholderia nemoris]|uniref:hypothetical protein n=1 Tax=Paraburkholderia nemoris TaxID=2793076 RepID=UPI00190BAA39|nr:hypothetical protein [Paraburkholderia nemoris]MBK3744182.1 hypothetical protein [Paraburkholderia aspalathi]CAE6767958.1 hypothetical protein R69619_03704 [Paraburkholderia nemoris]